MESHCTKLELEGAARLSESSKGDQLELWQETSPHTSVELAPGMVGGMGGGEGVRFMYGVLRQGLWTEGVLWASNWQLASRLGEGSSQPPLPCPWGLEEIWSSGGGM